MCVCVCVCVFITAGPITKLCAWGEEDSGDEPRLVWTRLTTTHY